jgi:phage tail tape-measure protein
MKTTIIALASAGLLAAGCTATGNVERNSAGGALLGAAAGAIIGNNVGGESAATGAAIGAAIGGTAGAIRGCRQDGSCGANSTSRRQYYDQRVGRYYYYDQRTGRYYWENGEPR